MMTIVSLSPFLFIIEGRQVYACRNCAFELHENGFDVSYGVKLTRACDICRARHEIKKERA